MLDRPRAIIHLDLDAFFAAVEVLEDPDLEGLPVLVGGSPRGTLYAVYHYLEASCRVGFFADGEHIPRLGEIPVRGIDLVERPRWLPRRSPYFLPPLACVECSCGQDSH